MKYYSKNDIIPRNDNQEKHGLCVYHFCEGELLLKSYFINNKHVGYSEHYHWRHCELNLKEYTLR